MRNSKQFIIITLVLFVALFIKFSGIIRSKEHLESFRGASIEQNIWNPLIADSVNEQLLSILVDNREITNQESGVYMDENLQLMVPVSVLRDSFNCSVHMYEDMLLIEKRNNRITFVLGESSVTINDEIRELTSAMTIREGEYYIPASAVSELLDFSYDWDIDRNQAVAANQMAGESILPASYDLRQRGRTPAVKNQENYGTCWAFSALSALESSQMPENVYEFSADHMVRRNSFHLPDADGGLYTMGMAYLTAWQGPVYEKDDPYGDGMSPENLEPVKHVQEIQLIDRKDFEKIKEAVFKYGGVQTSIYSALTSSQSESPYYNPDTFGYCYIGTEISNHMVTIIGWDDNFSKDNFKIELEGDGAFICQNSWGKEFGEDGIFYVSYYDVNIGSHNLVYTGVEEPDNYDHIYQSDLCGWVGQLGYARESAYGANVYTAQGEEQLMAAGFYALGKDTEYELYVVSNFSGKESLAAENRKLAASGKLSNAGYYTIDFDSPVSVEKGEKYAIVLYISTPGLEKPLAIEYAADNFTDTVDLSDGEGYISALGGSNWESLEESQSSNLCLKVYSRNRQ